MAIATQGPVSFSEVQTEFGGSNPISLSEYYREGTNVPVGANTEGIPTSGTIDISEFRGKSPNADVVYELIGGGGAGGYGRDDGGEDRRGTYGDAGDDSTLSGTGITTVTSTGGTGGENCGGDRNTVGTAGSSSAYGSGGAGGSRNNDGSNAPTESYGAGGGGGGGDKGGTFDSGGCSGFGGGAAAQQTGTVYPRYGTDLTIVIGEGGSRNSNTTDGGKGASGFASINIDGTETTYTSVGTFTLAVT